MRQDTAIKERLSSHVAKYESPNSRSHWIIYALGTFISFFVFLEFLGAIFFLSRFSPSAFIYYLTPAYILFGRTLPTFLLSALLILFFYIALSSSVYGYGGKKTVISSGIYLIKEKGLIFQQENSKLLLPFYIITLASLGYHIIITPLDLSHVLTYIIFLLFAVSFIEYYQVALKDFF